VLFIVAALRDAVYSDVSVEKGASPL